MRKYVLTPLTFALLVPALFGGSNQTGAAPARNAMAHPAFQRVWERTDALVGSGQVKRTWFWGPQPNTAGLYEEYKEGANGKRLVQYFDKSRMEINNPAADPNGAFFVTNGLLTVELISGRMQTGNGTFVNRQPSQTNLTGDAGDPLAPTYADLRELSNAVREKRDPDRTGKPVVATLARGGKTGEDAGKESVQGSRIAYYEPRTGHNISQVFWEFLNSTGPVLEGGATVERKLSEPWFYASGLPISDPYWTRVQIAGKASDVLVQAYERRVLTYVPTNPVGFQVEVGNIGQHYYDWRYSNSTPTPVPTPVPTTAPVPRYVVDVLDNTTAQTLTAMKAAGADGVRVYANWAGMEGSNVSPDQYTWAKYDQKFKGISDAGLQAIAVVETCPTWACDSPEGPVRPDKMGDFVEFMGALAQRYGSAPYNVHIWEMFNEPDDAGGSQRANWGMRGSEYATMLKAIRPAVRAADPAARIAMGGLAYDNFTEGGGPFNRRFVDDVFTAGGGQYLDLFNFHFYTQNINWCSFSLKLSELRAKLKAYGLSNMPIISTESGLTSEAAFSSSDTLQSAYVGQLYAQGLGEGMLSLTWFLAQDFETQSKGSKLFQKSGLLDLSGTPKPSYQAYRTAVQQMGQRPATRVLGSSDGTTGKVRGYEFGSDTAHPDALWILWAWDIAPPGAGCGTMPGSADYTVPARAAARFKQAVDMYGQPVATRKLADGSITFSLGVAPVYLQFSK